MAHVKEDTIALYKKIEVTIFNGLIHIYRKTKTEISKAFNHYYLKLIRMMRKHLEQITWQTLQKSDI